VHDLREHQVPTSAEELAGFETDVLARFRAVPPGRGLADRALAQKPA